MAVNYRMGRRGGLSNYNAQPRSRVTVWKPLGEPTPPAIPIELTLGAGNTLAVGDIVNPPEWFTDADFVLVTSNGNVTFEWNGTGWDADGEFFDTSGSGYLVQGSDTQPARWLNAEISIGNAILQGDGSYWLASNNLIILWSGV